MTEDDIRYLFESTDKYPVSHETIAKYITAPKKISVKKLIEQNELNAVKDYIVSMNDEYSFTLNAFKYCIINHKCKFVKLFLAVEETIINERIAVHITRISQLEQQILTLNNGNSVDKQDVSTNTDTTAEINTAVNVVSSDVSAMSGDLQKKINNITATLCKISTQLESLSDIEEQVNKISELSIISSKLDKFINVDIVKQLDTHSRKINSINIM